MTETNSNENIGSINNTNEEEITSSSVSITPTPTPTPTPTNSTDPHRRRQQEQNKKRQDEKIRKDQKRKRLCIGTSILFIIIALSIIVVIGIKFKEKLQDESSGSHQQNNNNNMTDYYEWCEQKHHNMRNQEVFSMNENQNCRITVSLKQKQIVYDALFSSEFDDVDSFFSNGKNICPCEGLDKCCTNEEKAYEWFVRLSNSDHYRNSNSHDRDDDRYLKVR